MITQKTASDIWECYREILASEKLIEDIEGQRDEYSRDDFEPKLKDVFGRDRKLQLGVPSGENAHKIYGVSADLALTVIRAHVANKKAALVAANERARIELDTPESAP